MPRFFRKLGALVGGIIVFAMLLLAAHLLFGIVADLLLLAAGAAAFIYWLKNQIWPSAYYTRTASGRCPYCEADLSKVGKGETYCPNCGEVIPAPLRKW